MTSTQSDNRQAIRISLQDIVVRFGAHAAADHVSLIVEPGEIVALLGPSGCGKTTTLRVIAGLQAVQSGSVRFDDAVISDTPSYKRNVGMVFQSYALFPHMTIRENVLFGLQMHRCPPGEREERIAHILDLMQITDLANAFPDQLSGGQQQRAALARTLVVKPSVLLLDEPLSALDRQLRDAMRTELRALLKGINITTVIVTHDQDEALTLADRVAVMRKGRIEQIGTPAEIYNNPATRFVASFIGQTNYVPGQIVRVSDARAEVRIAEELTIHAVRNGQFTPNDPVDVAIRPELISILPGNGEREALMDGSNVMVATVDRSVFLGGLTTHHLQLSGGHEIIVSQTPNGQHHDLKHPQPGDQVLLAWPVANTMVMHVEGKD